jgi:hypothetical protein
MRVSNAEPPWLSGGLPPRSDRWILSKEDSREWAVDRDGAVGSKAMGLSVLRHSSSSSSSRVIE